VDSSPWLPFRMYPPFDQNILPFSFKDNAFAARPAKTRGTKDPPRRWTDEWTAKDEGLGKGCMQWECEA
jgi:hypothetical protein